MRQGTDYFRQEDVDIHIIITNSTAVVTGVVDDVPTISGATFVITDEDLAQEAFEIHGGICSQERPIIGLCESTQLSFSVLWTTETEIVLPQVDEKVAAYMWFNEDSSNLMQIGYYNIESIDNSLNDTEIKYSCFDDMYKFRNTDVAEWYYGFFETNSTPTIREFTEGLCDELGISLSGALVNGTLEIKQFIFDKDIISAGYLFSLIAEANGGFGNIKYDGSFHIVNISAGQTNAITITEDDRFDSNRGSYEYKFKPTGVKLLDSNGVRIAKYRDVKENPYIITNNLLLISIDEENRNTALKKIYNEINAWGFAACDVTTIGDLMVELGDRIRVNEEAEEDTDDDGFFKTFVFERIYTGVYLPKDEYKAKGSKEMTQTESIAISDSFTGGSVAPNTNQEVSKNYQIIGTSMSYDDLPEIIRNFGLRLLDEPTNVSISKNDGIVGLQWTDPNDLTDDKPCPVTWAGTKVVRANGKAPLNPFKSEYTVIADVTTRNQYEDEPLYDIVSTDNNYVYGIFPYDTEGHYRYTKSIGISTDYSGNYPIITSVVQDNSSVLVNFTLPSGTWASRKLVYKQGGIPEDATDGTAIELASTDTQKYINDIDEGDTYYFVIFMHNSSYNVDSNCIAFTMRRISVISQGIFNCYGVDVDTHISRENSAFSGGYSYEGNAINFYEDENGKYWGGEAYSNNWQCSTIPLHKSDWDYLCFEVESQSYGGGNARASCIASNMIITRFNNPPLPGDVEVHPLFVRKEIVKGSAQTSGTPVYNFPLGVVKVDLSLLTSEDFYIAISFSDGNIKVRKCWLEKVRE